MMENEGSKISFVIFPVIMVLEIQSFRLQLENFLFSWWFIANDGMKKWVFPAQEKKIFICIKSAGHMNTVS